MSDQRTGFEPDLRALFSDTTEEYLIPAQPDLHDKVTIRLRTGKNEVEVCFLVAYGSHLRMHLSESDELFDYYSVRLEVSESPLRYYFMFIAGGKKYRYTRRGIRNTIRPGDWWHVVPGFHPPEWAAGAVMYQIFVDRFFNGDKSNDVVDGEYYYMGRPVVKMNDWNQPPSSISYCEFYGGDLKGVMEKLDYLQDLGVEAIYLNPIFLSPSSHKYDTQDYEHIDPHFGKIVKDVKNWSPEPGRQNGIAGFRPRFPNARAERYLERVTNPANLEASDKLFAKLVRKAHKRGIRVILDGVFNHCGSFHRWMDSEKIYEKMPGETKGARSSKKSPYVDYFRFSHDDWPSNDSYDSWWDFGTLPKLDYEKSESLCEYILDIARKWVSPPYCADGWRLDVASDLSYSQSFNHEFWKRFRKAVKEANPEAIIIAENYMDSWKWLQGDEWDTIMNYEFFMEPVTFFLTGMEKHSDARNEERYGDPEVFWRTVLGTGQEALPASTLQISMNELSNHDHSRFLTRTNRVIGRSEDLGPAAAMEDVSMEIMRQAVLLQMTWTGAPTIYYGDEAGLGGFTDPDNRRTYPWGRENHGLIRCHKALAAFRKNSAALRRGSIMRLSDEDGVLAYARTIKKDGRRETNIILLNINHIKIHYETNVSYAGVPTEANLVCLFATGRGFCRARCADSVFLERPAREESGKKRRKKRKAPGSGADNSSAAAESAAAAAPAAAEHAMSDTSASADLSAEADLAAAGTTAAEPSAGTTAGETASAAAGTTAEKTVTVTAETTADAEASAADSAAGEKTDTAETAADAEASATDSAAGEKADTAGTDESGKASARAASVPGEDSAGAAAPLGADIYALNNDFAKYPLRELLGRRRDHSKNAHKEVQKRAWNNTQISFPGQGGTRDGGAQPDGPQMDSDSSRSAAEGFYAGTAFSGPAHSAAAGFTADETYAADETFAADAGFIADAGYAADGNRDRDMAVGFSADPAHSAAPGFTSDAADTAKENRDSGREGTVSEPETDYLPPVISVREGIMRITLPPESGFLLRWSSVTEE